MSTWYKRWWWLAIPLLALALHAADYLHARWVAQRYAEWSETIVRGADGVREGFEPIKTGEGEQGLLFVHGFAGSPSLFRYFIEDLASAGYRCKAIRLPGFGEPVTQAATVTADDWLETVREAADLMRSDTESLWIVAHSLGATIALQAWQEDAGLADGLVLITPLLEVSTARSPLLTPRAWFRVGRRLLVYSTMFESIFPVDAHDDYVREAELRDRFIPFPIYAEIFAMLKRFERQPAYPEVPLLLMLAENDRIVDNATARQWFEAVPGDDKSLLTQPRAGHVIPLDTGWQEAVEEMKTFMQQYAQ